jgi:predicted DNA-binding transcriptional regulator YafY
MSRAERLLNLIEELRRHRRPVSGQVLAEALGVSIRTLYRDIASLRAQGATIDAEPGLGFVLRPGYLLPPLMFPDDEIEALVLGSRWVAERADPRLAEAARNALARIGGALPAEVAERLDATHLIVGPPSAPVRDTVDLSVVRRAIRSERKLRIAYRDSGDKQTDRLIWPFLLGYFDGARLVSAWCELRQDIRHFRTDRIVGLDETGTRYPRRRHDLLKAWRETDPSARTR